MTDVRRPLTQDQHDALVEIIEREQPELLPLARDAVNARWLDDAEAKALVDALLGVFLAHLGPDEEPDRYGAAADDLTGLIEMQRRGYWAD